MTPVRPIMARIMFGMALAIAAEAEEIGCVETTWRVWADDNLCVSAFDAPKVPGVTGHLLPAHTGGCKGTVGVAEDRSWFAMDCRQAGPITGELAPRPDGRWTVTGRQDVTREGPASAEQRGHRT